MGNEIVYINLDDIIPNRFQPREIFDEQALNELADSIRQHGVIEPIIVRPVLNKYEIIAGERRYKASSMAGLTKIPCIIRDMDDKESSLVAYIENEQRKDVSVIEKARTANRILKANNMTQEELATSLGISQSTLANRLRLLDLPLEVQESLMRNEISERHARSLLSIKDVGQQLALLKEIKDKKMTVRELESEIKKMNGNIDQQATNEVNGYLNNVMSTLPGFNTSSPTTDNGFNMVNDNYQNGFNTTPNDGLNLPPISGVQETTTPFMDNSFNMPPIDNNEKSSIPPVNDSVNNGMEYLNSNSTMEYLNNSDDNSSDTGSTGGTTNFMEYLNNFNNQQNDVSNSNLASSTNNFYSNDTSNNTGFTNFLNNYTMPDSNQNNINNSNINSNTNDSGLLINNTTPPITTNFNSNSYVEDNPSFVDVSKKEEINDIDGIIKELKTTIDDIKSKSKFKIDTDEINFDDLYQITIKIDKRDF